jgi:hypothetical protein
MINPHQENPHWQHMSDLQEQVGCSLHEGTIQV